VAQKYQVDLHTHSTASDGLLSPVELVHEASRGGLRFLGLTDHDTIAGIQPAMDTAAALEVEVIPGIELSSDADGAEVHILGYYIDPTSQHLHERLEYLVATRNRRNEAMVRRLNDAGLAIDYERVLEIAGGGTVGRPHIARALVESGYVSSTGEAFGQYLTRGKPGYVPREKVSPEDAVRLVRAAGGAAVLAHPMSAGELDPLLERLISAGLAGMEVFYGEYDRTIRNRLYLIARRWNLIPAGGSDYHGEGFKEGRSLGSVDVPLETVTLLQNARG
jgi:3',5'-nucleoside bisphosphate phosphatase